MAQDNENIVVHVSGNSKVKTQHEWEDFSPLGPPVPDPSGGLNIYGAIGSIMVRGSRH